MAKIIDAVLILHTPEIVRSFPKVWFDQLTSAREGVGLDNQVGLTGVPLEHIIAQMDEAGVERGLLEAPNMAQWGIRVAPESVIQAVERYPDRLVPGGLGVNPHEGARAIRELETYVKNYGFRAAHVHPHWIDRPANEALYYPVYAKCVELNLPVFIQLKMPSQSFLRSHGRPRYIEDVATFFPELRIVGFHLGWPWVDEFIGLLTKHPNLYMTTSVYPTSSWSPGFARFVNGHGQDKIIFGSAAPMVKGGIKEALQGIASHKLDESVRRKILGENAARVFGL